MVNNSVDCNQLFIVVNLIEDQILHQDQDQIPLTFQDSIPRYCTGIKIISKRQNRFFQIVKFFKGSFIVKILGDIKYDFSDQRVCASVHARGMISAAMRTSRICVPICKRAGMSWLWSCCVLGVMHGTKASRF